MKSIIRNLLLIIVFLQFLFMTGCSSYWIGFAAVLQVAYGVTTAATDRDSCPDCVTTDIVIIPCPPETDPVIIIETVSDSESSYNREVDPQKKTADESDSRQSGFTRRPFARR